MTGAVNLSDKSSAHAKPSIRKAILCMGVTF